MARLPRLIVRGLPHLIRQQVQHGQTLAVDVADRKALVERIRLSAQALQIQVHAYAVRPERFDLVVTPSEPQALSSFMQAVARGHSTEFNQRHARSGSLWMGRFRIAVLDPDEWILPCMVYVEQQLQADPLAADPSLDHAGGAPVSSAAHHGGADVDRWLNDPPAYWALGNTPFEREQAYRALLQQVLSQDRVVRIEQALRGGWALGDEKFMLRIASHATRPTQPRPPGRPSRGRSE